MPRSALMCSKTRSMTTSSTWSMLKLDPSAAERRYRIFRFAIAAAAGSGTASTIESSLEGMVAMMALSIPLSSPASFTFPLLVRDTPGWGGVVRNANTRNWQVVANWIQSQLRQIPGDYGIEQAQPAGQRQAPEEAPGTQPGN